MEDTYTKKQVRKMVHDAFKAGLTNEYHARSDNDLSGQKFSAKRPEATVPEDFYGRAAGACNTGAGAGCPCKDAFCGE